MSIYLFESSTICKNPRFWIDEDIISRKKIAAATLAEACEQYAEAAAAAGVEISKTQQKRHEKIYIDDCGMYATSSQDSNAQQCGYLFKATTDIYDEERQKWTKCRAEIWVTVYELRSPFLAD